MKWRMSLISAMEVAAAEVSGETLANIEYMEVTFAETSDITTNQMAADDDDDEEIEYGSAFKPSHSNFPVCTIINRSTLALLVVPSEAYKNRALIFLRPLLSYGIKKYFRQTKRIKTSSPTYRNPAISPPSRHQQK